MQQCDLDKQVTRYRRLSCILGVCCITLLTANAVLVAQAWPCLTSAWEARRCACPTTNAATPPSTHEVLDQSDSFHSVGDVTHGFVRRTSSDTSSSNTDTSGSSSSSSSDGHEGHPHDAMLFLFNGIIIGVLVLHVTTHPKLHSIQHTSSLFVLGMGYALVMEGLHLRTKLGVLGRSYSMWMQIDPHLILFTLLPALLAGDAMAIDTSIVRRVASQCIYLAGPGVLVGALLTAGFVMLYSGWGFKLALTMGSILCATDPVAVVSLLKQLGASPTLTVQIAGESLLNDGTAIVLYTIAYEMLQGKTYEPSEILIFIVRKALCACGLGWVIGWVFVIWINAASNRFEHHSSTIQICLTLCCAYWSFIMAEGVLDMSGVLCTVAASMVLADKMWMSIVEKESMAHVWHIFEFIGNTLIFFLAGSLTGNCMVHMPLMDYLHLLVLYLVSMAIRGLIIFGSRPILQCLSPENVEVSKAEALIMTVGGLRGAVGLALAIQVSAQKDKDFVDEMDAQRVLFYTGGIATLTLVVNASICPTLVKACGLVQADDTKKKMLLILHQQMFNMATRMIRSDGVRQVLEELLLDVRKQIDVKYDKRNLASELFPVEGTQRSASDESVNYTSEGSAPVMRRACTLDGDTMAGLRRVQTYGLEGPNSPNSNNKSVFAFEEKPGSREGRQAFSQAPGRLTRGRTSAVSFQAIQSYFSVGVVPIADGSDIVEDFKHIKQLFERSLQKHRRKLHLLDLPEISELKDEPNMIDTVENVLADHDMFEATTVAFLGLVRAQYWHQIDNGEFIQGSTHPEVLMTSIAIGAAARKLTDLDFLIQELGMTDFDFGELRTSRLRGSTASMRSGVSESSRGVLRRAKTNLQDVLAVSKVLSNGGNVFRHRDPEFAKKIISSTAFNAIITCVILANVLNVFIEEGYKQSQSDDYSLWLGIEIAFNVVFIIEFLLKVVALGCAYFKSSWNCFELSLICLGIFGICVEVHWQLSDEKDENVLTDEQNLSQEARIFRLNRVFRVMRLVRVFRLVKFIQILQAKLAGNEISLELATHLRKITLLTAYIRATQESQVQLMQYFGGPTRARVELARCLIESQSNILKAATMAICELSKVDAFILESLSVLRESGRIADSLSDFIAKAQKVDVVSSREADNLLAPLHHRRRIWLVLLRESEMGVVRQCFEKFGVSQSKKNLEDDSFDNPIEEDVSKDGPSGFGPASSGDFNHPCSPLRNAADSGTEPPSKPTYLT